MWAVSVAVAQIDHQVVEQRRQRSQRRDDISVGRRTQGTLRITVGVGAGDIVRVEPHQCPTGGVDFDRKRNKREERGDSEEDDAAEQQSREFLHQQDAEEENPRRHLAREIDCRDHLGAQTQPIVGGGVLHRMAAFMGGDSSGGDAGSMVDIPAKVERFVHRVVMVGQRTVDLLDGDVADVVVAKHLLRHVATRHTVVHRNLGILLEFRLHALARDEAQDEEHAEDNPDNGDVHCYSSFG